VSREAHHDTDGTAGQTVDVVPDGPDQMDERVAGQQSLQSGAVESGEKRVIQDFLSSRACIGWLGRSFSDAGAQDA